MTRTRVREPRPRSVTRYLLALARELILGVACALLPSPERDRFARDQEIDAPLWSLRVGFVQGAFGLSTFLIGGLAFMRPAASDQSMMLLENWIPGLNPTHFRGLGLINWIAWFLHPLSWPFAYLALVGLVRCVAFAVTREAVGEPVVWVALRLVQRSRDRVAGRRRERWLGPRRPDRVLRGEGGALVVLTCREKPAWTPTATIAIDDRYYRVAGVEELRDGDWHAVAYRLREQKPGEIIRGLVRYDPPPP